LCLIPARPSPADIEASGPTLARIRASGKPFAFVLNQTHVRSSRLNNAAALLGDTATSLNMMGVLALPYIVLRNDQQDALGQGLAVTEYALGGKSADEIRNLWQWVWSRLISVMATDGSTGMSAAPANAQAGLRAAG
jgi:chromosome partitioning protein